MMGDVAEFYVDNEVRNHYFVSISGYHIDEAGANPITQAALTLSNGLTYVELFKSRGLDPDKFLRNFSWFFSNGMDPEYAVIGRVSRRIWAIAMRDLYGVGERGQKLKYHIQSSGRSYIHRSSHGMITEPRYRLCMPLQTTRTASTPTAGMRPSGPLQKTQSGMRWRSN